MQNRFRLPLLGLSALMVGACSGDTGESPSIVGSWVATAWRETSVADTSRHFGDPTHDELTLRFVATAGGTFTWTMAFPAATQQVSGTYTLRDSTLTFRYSDGNNTIFTTTVAATTLVLWQPLSLDFGNGLEAARSTLTFKRE
jgi:hypothetical protein